MSLRSKRCNHDRSARAAFDRHCSRSRLREPFCVFAEPFRVFEIKLRDVLPTGNACSLTPNYFVPSLATAGASFAAAGVSAFFL